MPVLQGDISKVYTKDSNLQNSSAVQISPDSSGILGISLISKNCSQKQVIGNKLDNFLLEWFA